MKVSALMVAPILGLMAGTASAATMPPTQLLSGTQYIGFDRPESWAMKYFASASLLTSMGPPRALKPGAIRLGFEAGIIPYLSETERTVGFNGTKTEDLNRVPVTGRLRVTLGLPWLLSITFGYLPPIPINNVQASLYALSIGRPFKVQRDITLGVAVYGQLGSIDGDFTCPRAAARAGNNPQLNPYGCIATSADSVDPDYVGLELTGSYRIRSAHGLEPYVGIAVNYMNLTFHVNSLYGNVIDHTTLRTQGATFSSSYGLLYPVTHRLDIAAEAFYSPLNVNRPPGTSTFLDGFFNVRALIAYRFF